MQLICNIILFSIFQLGWGAWLREIISPLVHASHYWKYNGTFSPSFGVIEDNDAEEVSDNGIRSPEWELPALFCVPEWIFTPEVTISSVCALKSHPSVVMGSCQRAASRLTVCSSCQQRWDNSSWSSANHPHCTPAPGFAMSPPKDQALPRSPPGLAALHKSARRWSFGAAFPRSTPLLAPALPSVWPIFWPVGHQEDLFKQGFGQSLRWQSFGLDLCMQSVWDLGMGMRDKKAPKSEFRTPREMVCQKRDTPSSGGTALRMSCAVSFAAGSS